MRTLVFDNYQTCTMPLRGNVEIMTFPRFTVIPGVVNSNENVGVVT